MAKKYLKPKPWNHYPAEELEAKGDKVIQSNLKENIATVAIVVAGVALVGFLWWFFR